jgi:hypothetical protein
MPNGQICLSESIAEFDLTRARVRVRANEARLAADERVTEGRTPLSILCNNPKPWPRTEKMTVIVPVSEAVLDWLVSKTIWPRRNAPPDDVEQLVSGAAQRSSREETQARAKIRGAGCRGERV